MPRFHDPSRPRLGNDRPCWLPPAAEHALPGVWVEPLPVATGLAAGKQPWLCQLLVDGQWMIRELEFWELVEFLRTYELGPEEALRDYFGVQPPVARKRGESNKTEASAEELGL